MKTIFKLSLKLKKLTITFFEITYGNSLPNLDNTVSTNPKHEEH